MFQIYSWNKSQLKNTNIYNLCQKLPLFMLPNSSGSLKLKSATDCVQLSPTYIKFMSKMTRHVRRFSALLGKTWTKILPIKLIGWDEQDSKRTYFPSHWWTSLQLNCSLGTNESQLFLDAFRRTGNVICTRSSLRFFEIPLIFKIIIRKTQNKCHAYLTLAKILNTDYLKYNLWWTLTL